MPGTQYGDASGHWIRIVMNEAIRRLVGTLPVAQLDCLEISGHGWQSEPFRSYTQVWYPDYDVCAAPLPRSFDLVIAEQVLEHVPHPWRAVRHIHDMLRPGGWFLSSTPFLIRVHREPEDYSRWTEAGIRELLADAGFPAEGIQTGSWGNRACLEGNYTRWPEYEPEVHSLENEPDFPLVVWALARR